MPALLIDESPLTADLHGMAAVALVGHIELDAAVAVTVVVPVEERATLRQASSTRVNGRLG